ncbi:hypothetical protein HanPI659440_Chr13g0486391 [Helianthus annuus]|nr:hypothetical protein HanPI659440_Chr13g0486391 [Helianthus annuus]
MVVNRGVFLTVRYVEGEIWDFDVVGGLRTVYDGDERWLSMYSDSLILGVSWLAFVSLLHVSFKPAMVVAFFFPWISMCLAMIMLYEVFGGLI